MRPANKKNERDMASKGSHFNVRSVKPETGFYVFPATDTKTKLSGLGNNSLILSEVVFCPQSV